MADAPEPPEPPWLRRLKQILNKIQQDHLTVMDEARAIRENQRRDLYGLPTHLIPIPEREMHIAHESCVCEPRREEPVDGPTRWRHRIVMN